MSLNGNYSNIFSIISLILIIIFLVSVSGDIFCEFLEVAVHGILYNRGLYPAGVFEKRKKYSIPVQVPTFILILK